MKPNYEPLACCTSNLKSRRAAATAKDPSVSRIALHDISPSLSGCYSEGEGREVGRQLRGHDGSGAGRYPLTRPVRSPVPVVARVPYGVLPD